MGISTILAVSYLACLLWATGYWMKICKAKGTDSMFVDHLPLVLYVGVLKHEAIKGVVVVVTICFCAPRTTHFVDLGVTLWFWGGVSVGCGLLI